MSIKNNQGSDNIPQLRFPEFQGEWEKKKLGEVAEKIQDGTHFSPQVFDKGDYLYLTSKNVKNGYLELSNAQYISKESHESIYKRCDVRKGDVLITKDGTIGQTCVNDLAKQFSLLSSVAFIRPNDEFSNYFIYQLLVSPKGQKEIESQIAGQALKRVTLTKINNFEYFFPTLPEQTKIASFLTAVDEKIQALKKKHHLLEQYKKGVMQMLFCLHHDSLDLHDDPDSQGEQQEKNQGNHENQKKSRFRQLRFKDENGHDFPEWEVMKGGDLFESISNKNHNSDLPILAISQEFGAVPREMINYQISVTDKSVESYKVVEVGDFIISLRSFQGGIEYSNYKGICSPAYVILRNTLLISKIFFKYYFKTDYYIQKLCEKLEGIRDGKMISYKYFSEIELPYPSIAEQTAIANFLSALDEKINLQTQMIASLEQWKKGLLQKMFV